MTAPLWDASCYLELSVHEVGREVCIAGKTIQFDPKTYPLLHYVYSGKGCLVREGRTYHLSAGDCFYIAPGEVVSYFPLEEDPWSYFWVGIGGSKAQSLLESVGFSPGNPVLHDSGKVWKGYFENIYESYFHSGEFGIDVLGYAYLLLFAMTKGKKGDDQNKEKGHIQAAKAYIRNNFQFPITVDDVAKSVGVSPNYLANLFQQQGIASPKAYLTEIRMGVASSLLLESKSAIGDIAKAVGYRNPLHFSKIFKNYYGISPLQFRNQGGIQE